MFYKDHKGIDIIQFGTGSVAVSTIKIEGTKPSECIGIAFMEWLDGTIGRVMPDVKGKKDYEAGVKLKLLFTKVKSIDVVINALEKIKKEMEEINFVN